MPPPGQPEPAFQWPPREPTLDHDASDTPAGDASAAVVQPRTQAVNPGPIRQALLDIEAAFLAPTATTWPPEGWTPEPVSAACPRCATTVGPGEADGEGCPACRDRRLRWDRAFRLGEYEGDLADAIRRVKFTPWRRLATDLGRHLGRRLAPELDRLGISPSQARLVPMPTATARRLARGIDHPLALARGVRAEIGIPIARVLTKKLRPPNADLPRSARRANVAGSIRLKKEPPIPLPRRDRGEVPAVAILLDDVRTTGATLTVAARALRTHPEWFPNTKSDHPRAALWIASLAVTPSDDRRFLSDRAGSADA